MHRGQSHDVAFIAHLVSSAPLFLYFWSIFSMITTIIAQAKASRTEKNSYINHFLSLRGQRKTKETKERKRRKGRSALLYLLETFWITPHCVIFLSLIFPSPW